MEQEQRRQQEEEQRRKYQQEEEQKRQEREQRQQQDWELTTYTPPFSQKYEEEMKQQQETLFEFFKNQMRRGQQQREMFNEMQETIDLRKKVIDEVRKRLQDYLDLEEEDDDQDFKQEVYDDLYYDHEIENFQNSNDVQSFVEDQKEENTTLSKEELNKKLTLVWKIHKQVKQVISRKGNNTQIKIVELDNENIYIPSNGNCLFKCIKKYYEIYSQQFQKNELYQIINRINQIQQENYINFFNLGISSKEAVKICKQLKVEYGMAPEYKKLVEFEQRKLGDRNQYLIQIENHYCLIFNKSVQTIEFAQKYINKCRNCKVFISQNDISNLISKKEYIDAKIEQIQLQKEQVQQQVQDEDFECEFQTEEQEYEQYLLEQAKKQEEVKQEVKKEVKQKPRKFILASSDIESYQTDRQVPYLTGFQYVLTEQNQKSKDQKLDNKIHSLPIYNRDPKKMINTLFDSLVKIAEQNKTKRVVLYFHNGRKYDNLLLLENYDQTKYQLKKNIKVKGNAIECIFQQVKKKNPVSIELLDSSLILQGSLDSICKSYNLDNRKQDSTCIKNVQSYEEFYKNRKQIIEYFIKDVLSLQEAVIKVRNFLIDFCNVDICSVKTIGSIALKFYQDKYNPKYTEYQYFFNNVQLNEWIRKFIQGGRTQCKKRLEKDELLYYLDFNSLYPSAMVEIEKRCKGYYILDRNAISLNENQIVDLQEKINSDYDDYLEEFYLIECDISIPKDNVFITNYMRYKQGVHQKTGYVTGDFKRQHLSSWDIVQLVKYNNAKIEIRQAIQLKTKVDMKLGQMMLELKDQRDHYRQKCDKKCCKITGKECKQTFTNDAGQQMVKCLMNSTYGKFIQKPIYSQYKVQKTKCNGHNGQIQQVIQIKDQFLVKEQHIELDQQFNCSNAMIGIQILAMSKIMMNESIDIIKGFDSKENMIAYTDTDSIIVKKDQYELLNKKGLIGNDFGQMKLEQILQNFESYGKKMYNYESIYDCDDKENKVSKETPKYGFRLKGVAVKDETQVKNIFDQLRENRIHSQKITQFVRDLKNQNVIVKNQDDEEAIEKIVQNTYQNDQYLCQDKYYLPLHI